MNRPHACPVDYHHAVGHRHAAAAGKLGLGEGAARADMIRSKALGQRVESRERDAVLLPQRRDLGAGLVTKERLHRGEQFPALEADHDVVELGSGERGGRAHHRVHALPLARGEHAEPDIAVRHRDDRILHTLGWPSGGQRGGGAAVGGAAGNAERRIERLHRTIQCGEIDRTAGAADERLCQRGHRDIGALRDGTLQRDFARWQQRRVALDARARKLGSERVEHAVGPLPVREGIAAAEAGCGHLHERRVRGAQRGPVDAAGWQVLDHEVGISEACGEVRRCDALDLLAEIGGPVGDFGARVAGGAGASAVYL